MAVEIKRIGTIEAVEQLTRYLEVHAPRSGASDVPRNPRGAEREAAGAPLCEARGLGCVEVDLEVLRGEREPELTLFNA